MRVTAAAGHVLNLLLVLRVLAARAFRGLRILLLALGLVLNQPLFDRLLATKGVRIDRDIALRAHEPRDRKRPRPRPCPLVGRRRTTMTDNDDYEFAVP